MSYRANGWKAVLTISRYSLLATLKSPTSVVFSLLFPVIFIVVFGSVDVGKAPVTKLAVGSGTDTSSALYKAISAIPAIALQTGLAPAVRDQQLKKGSLGGVLRIVSDSNGHYTVLVQASPSAADPELMETMINETVSTINLKAFPQNRSVATVVISKLPGRVYRSIDFILPGQLGFSLLMAGVYGSSFLLFYLRQNLVLKRLRATPVKRTSILAGEMLSRLFFHVISFVIMVALGCFVFRFTLVNGMETFAEMLLFSLFGVSIFMGIGFIISGVVQHENAISPIANTVVLPQLLLCGLFFPVENYPHYMQVFCNILPLTLFVDGLRKIAFEGTHIWQMATTIAGLLLWTCIIAPVAVKSFKW